MRCSFALLLLVLPACAALSSWDGFAGGEAPDRPARDAGKSTADAGGDTPSPSKDAGDEAPPPPPIKFVQARHTAFTDDAPQTTVTVPIEGQQAGDLIVVAIGWFDANGRVASVTDSTGATYRVAAPPKLFDGRDALQHAIYYLPNVPAAASNTITVTFSPAGSGPDVRVLEYSGLDPTDPLDQTSSSAASGALVTSGTMTTRFERELLFSASISNGNYTTASAKHTLRLVTTDGNLAQDLIVDKIGAYAGEAVLDPPDDWVMQLVTFH